MTTKVKLLEIVEGAKAAGESLLKKSVESVISAESDGEGGWKVVVEVIERKAVPDTQDIVGKYEMTFDRDGDVVGYRRIELRRRGSMEAVEDEE